MRYAISRAAEYDVQSKLTWLVDSLLTNRPGLPNPSEDDERKDEAGTMVRTLQRILRGEKVKASRKKKLGRLPEICHPASEIDPALGTILELEEVTNLPRIYSDLAELSTSCQESIGLGLSSVDDSISGIAHRAVAGPPLQDGDGSRYALRPPREVGVRQAALIAFSLPIEPELG